MRSILGSNNQVHDIALIRLNEPVPLYDEDPTKSLVTPICLPWRENDLNRTFKRAVIAGWGNIKTSIKNIEMKRNSPYITREIVTIANDVCKADPLLAPYWDPETKICTTNSTYSRGKAVTK